MANLVYYTVFGGDTFYDNLRLSIDSLHDFGRYTGDILVFSDRTFTYRGARNIVLPLADVAESVAIRITCYRYFDFAAYDKVLFLDADILVCRPIAPLLNHPETFTYFPQDDRYFTTGIIDALYFGADLWRRNWWKHPLNAGQFVLNGDRFAAFMHDWETVCERFAHRRVFTLNQSFKKIWRDQVAFNFLVRAANTRGMERKGIVYYPTHWLALRPVPLSRHALFPDRHILWHFSGIPAPIATREMRKRLQALRHEKQ